MVKVLWRNDVVEKVAWDPKEVLKSKYPLLFEARGM